MFFKASKSDLSLLLILAVVGFFGSHGAVFGETGDSELDTQATVVNTSEVTLPEGVPDGQYRRIIQPFRSWTMICDENLLHKRKTCNISQSIEDTSGNTIFSWTLAATEDGRPFFILRVPLGVSNAGQIFLEIADGHQKVELAISGCDSTICIGYQKVGPRLKKAIYEGGEIGIFYIGGLSKPTRIRAPLAGLSEAIDNL
ncbi:invasion associated locus B family protein [Agrobacterium radiobacter]|uniref:invasion associated locus B family protein n=1 Tax=Agrobacterium radiobacter TaxID=362 RepID=UPI000DDA96AA